MKNMKTSNFSFGDIENAFIDGFRAGKSEQFERDNPDVGFRIIETANDYFREYIKKLSENEKQK